MDILDIVKDDKIHLLELKHPVTEAVLGITLSIRSADSEEVKKVVRAHANANARKLQKQKQVSAEVLEEQAELQACSMIESWEWGSELTLNQEANPECNLKNRRALVERAAFFNQIVEASKEPANFT